jgi:hypothetical protein
MRQFTEIKGRFSEARELPRIGKIRLGLKVASKNGGSHPTETDYFVSPPEVQEVYGETPIELDVLLPSDKKEDFMRSKYAMYGSGAGLRCHGNGEEADRYNEKSKEWEPMKCPCPFLKTDENPKGSCTAKTSLMVMLPLVSMGGCYQITTGSAAATKNINSSIDLIRLLTGGRMAFLPMKLRRVPTDMTHEGHKRTHYIMSLVLNATWQQALQLRQHPDSMVIPAQYQIAAPLDENPELDPDDVVVDAETLADSSDAELAEIQKKLEAKQAQEKPSPKQETKPIKVQGDNGLSGVADAAPAGGLQFKDAPAPPKEPAKVAPSEAKQEKPNGKRQKYTEEQWKNIIAHIDMNADWATLKYDWKNENKVDNVMRLTDGGRDHFLAYMQEKIGAAFLYCLSQA